MDSARGIDIEKIRQLNNPSYVRTRLAALYIIIFAAASLAGTLLNAYALSFLPEAMLERISGVFLPLPLTEYSRSLLYEIIYNSVDIFKISFIILLAGFTYIASFVNRTAAVLAGIGYGFYCALCIDLVLKHDYYPDGNSVLLIALILIRFLALASVIVFSCVTSELYADVWRRFRGVASLLRSWVFWKYCIVFLVLFGYVILNETIFRFLLKIIL